MKGLDGAAHEAYQRTHSSSTDGDDLTSAWGCARRSAARAASAAGAFLAAELCEMMESMDDLEDFQNEKGTLAHREVLLQNEQVRLAKGVNVSFTVLWEPSYHGGAGLEHGGIHDLIESRAKKRGRLIVVVRDPIQNNLKKIVNVLDEDPLELELKSGLVANEIVSVHPLLYRSAGRMLGSIESTLRGPQFADVAIHFVGQSLAGGVASLAAVILDGSLPTHAGRKTKEKEEGTKEARCQQHRASRA